MEWRMGWDGDGMGWDGMVWYGMVWYGMVWYGVSVCIYVCVHVCVYVYRHAHALVFVFSSSFPSKVRRDNRSLDVQPFCSHFTQCRQSLRKFVENEFAKQQLGWVEDLARHKL